MMLNRVTLIGTVVLEPKQNSAATYFTLATWNHWNGRKFTTRTKIDVFGKLRESLPNMSEGDLILVEGKLNNSSYEKGGQKVWVTSVVANVVSQVSSSGLESGHEVDSNAFENAKEPSSYPPKSDNKSNDGEDFPW